MASDYKGAFEDWEIAIARKLSGEFLGRYGWLKGIDMDDLMQECLTQWHIAKGSYRTGKGASMSTYMAAVVRHRLNNILQEQLTARRKASHLSKSLDWAFDQEMPNPGDSMALNLEAAPSQPHVILSVDLEQAIQKLTPLQVRLCALLAQGYPVSEIAAVLGKPRSKVYEEIKEIRRTFSDAGLEAYLR